MEYSELIERAEARAELEKQEQKIELIRLLAGLCNTHEISRIIIYEFKAFDKYNFELKSLQEFDFSTIQAVCEQFEIPEHIRTNFSLPVNYWLWTL